MRTHRIQRRGSVCFAALLIVVLTASSASAAIRRVEYKGTTSATGPNRVLVEVAKYDSGRRVLRHMYVKMTLTYEDATTFVSRPTLGGARLSADGEFSLRYRDESILIRFEGVIGPKTGSGTAEFNWSRLTEDGQDAQLCSSGDLDWAVTRVPTRFQ